MLIYRRTIISPFFRANLTPPLPHSFGWLYIYLPWSDDEIIVYYSISATLSRILLHTIYTYISAGYRVSTYIPARRNPLKWVRTIKCTNPPKFGPAHKVKSGIAGSISDLHLLYVKSMLNCSKFRFVYPKIE